ncbi:MAG TPA: GTPase domain-containing protein [Geothrix sp.]|nr:GTPase domain-containing protein [Geothrix sp. SG198]HJV39530.1 GTPase domain-containing protein [Geothrix sp.]
MVFFNHATRQMTAKIVYYGPGLCGKTTNLNTIYSKTSQRARGEMVSLNTETDRTLFFDLLPMDVGVVAGFRTKLQLYTVPGQVFYNSTRKLVLKGVDGIVFVVDSQVPMLDACRESWMNLEENIRELGLNLQDIPVVFQWNKRDLKNVVSVDELEAVFNPRGVPSFQSVASDGTGVFETLRGITKLALSHIKTHVLEEPQAAPAPMAPRVTPESSEIEALTLSDLPSVTDLLDMDGPVQPSGIGPLPDLDDDTGIFIEAPHLPEPPAGDDGLAFLMEEGEPGFDAEAFSAFQGEAPVAEAAKPDPEPVTPWEPAPAVLPPVPKPAVKADPLAALASLKVEARRPAPPSRNPDPKDAISSLLEELTQVGRQGAPSVLRIEVPSDLEGQEIEVVVQLRHQGAVLAEGQIQRPAPAKGSTAKLSVELKRS